MTLAFNVMTHYIIIFIPLLLPALPQYYLKVQNFYFQNQCPYIIISLQVSLMYKAAILLIKLSSTLHLHQMKPNCGIQHSNAYSSLVGYPSHYHLTSHKWILFKINNSIM